MTPKPQTKKPQLPTTQEVEATNPQSEDDWIDAMPFICNNIRSDGTVCENIIESNDDLYAPHAITCGTCFDDAENPQPKKPRNPKHRTMSFRKARLIREAEATAQRYDCGCIDYDNDWFVGCESCGYKSCLDCHHIDATPVDVDDWKCKEGYGCKSHYNCTRCGHMGENNLVPEVGMVCDDCMTDADSKAWDAHNKLHNPDSYDEAYQCCSCEGFFAQPTDAHECPHCLSGNWVEGAIDDPRGEEE